MDSRAAHDPILTRFRTALAEIYGDRVGAALLSGMGRVRAARHGQIPDYDIAVFLRDMTDRWKELYPARRSVQPRSFMTVAS